MTNDSVGAGSAQHAQYSANRSDLAVFVEHGKQYVNNLEAIQERLRTRRALVADLLGADAGPVDGSTRALRELAAEARINTAFVEQIHQSLASSSGSSLRPGAMSARIDRDLDAARLNVDGADRSLERDQAAIRQFQSAQMKEAGLSPPTIGQLLGAPHAVDGALAVSRLGVHPDAFESVDVNRLMDVAELADRNPTRFDEEQLEALLTEAYAPDLDRQVMASLLQPPADITRARVLAAMVAGQTPQEAGLSAAYFPAPYRRLIDVEHEIDQAELRREVADGSSWAWWDSNDAALAMAEAELTELLRERATLVDLYDIRDGGAASFAASAAVSDATAGHRWEGEAYADHFIGFHDSNVSDGGWLFGGGKGAIRDPAGNDVELVHIGRRLTADPSVAVGFYNRVGVERVSNLPTFLAGNRLDPDSFDRYGSGLAAASRATGRSGFRALDFSGDELLAHPRSDTQEGVIWHSPALLFASGDFDPAFLAGAAEATLRMAEDGEDQATKSHLGRQEIAVLGGGTVVTFNGGEDPRNILLTRVAEDPAAVRLLITSLVGRRSRGWPRRPAAGTLDPLLKPQTPFGPTIGSNSETYWLDELRDIGNVADPDHSSISRAAYPDLTSEYPITTLLGAVAADPNLSRWTMLYTAGSVAAEGPMVQDPGTAAGLDLILAGHAPLMFEAADLAAVGIEPTMLNHDAPIEVRAVDWKAVHHEVLRYGRGQALAHRVDELLLESIVGAVAPDGLFRNSRPSAFAHMAARTDVEATDALMAYSAELDDRARAKNRKANVTASVAMALLGLGSGIASSVSSIGWAAFFDGYPTDRELQELREYRSEELVEDSIERWQAVVAEASLEARFNSSPEYPFSTIDLLVPGLGLRPVRIRRDTEPWGVGYRWQDPTTSIWAEIPPPATEEFWRLFGPDDLGRTTSLSFALLGVSRISEDYEDGVTVSIRPSPGVIESVERHRDWLGTDPDGAVPTATKIIDARADGGWTEMWVAEGRPGS